MWHTWSMYCLAGKFLWLYHLCKLSFCFCLVPSYSFPFYVVARKSFSAYVLSSKLLFSCNPVSCVMIRKWVNFLCFAEVACYWNKLFWVAYLLIRCYPVVSFVYLPRIASWVLCIISLHRCNSCMTSFHMCRRRERSSLQAGCWAGPGATSRRAAGGNSWASSRRSR